jgi:DNA-binding MarR family transcriptional regulator
MKPAEKSFVITDAFPTDALSWLMATCSKALRERLAVRFAKAGYGVTPEQWAILGRLGQEDGLSQQTLADRFHRSKVAAFQLISKLEARGMVERRPDPYDGRSRLVYLTEEGRRVQQALIALAKENMAEALQGVDEVDLDTAKKVVRQIINNASS